MALSMRFFRGIELASTEFVTAIGRITLETFVVNDIRAAYCRWVSILNSSGLRRYVQSDCAPDTKTPDNKTRANVAAGIKRQRVCSLIRSLLSQLYSCDKKSQFAV